MAPSMRTPYSAPCLATCAARALAISVFVGMQPTLTQVPPTRLRSRMAVLRPEAARRTASAGPACPVPMTIASYRSLMCLPCNALMRYRILLPALPIAPRAPRATGSWITTPSIGSTGAVHGARSIIRRVSA